MFNKPRKSLTPGSSKSVSPVPLEFAEEFEIRTDPEIIYSENVFNDSNDQEADNLQSSAYNGDTTLNPGIQYEYTNNHPMGKILLKMLQDNTQLAKKSGVKMMELGVDDLCKNFYNAQLMERNKLKSRILQTTADMEMSIIEREMNSHTINQQVTAPSSFSSAPTLLTPRQRSDCMKLLPSGSNKFSGSQSGMNILEYLHLLKAAQAQCNLSQLEFLEMMLASTTGQAYMLLHGWIENGDDPTNIFHNLLVHYDKRLQPEEAKSKLYAYKAPKSADLAKVESTIQSLAARATSNMPPGIAKSTAYDLEVIGALIRALPKASSLIVQDQNNEKSARMGKPLTAVKLSRVLHLYRHTIDQDIKANGVDNRGNEKKFVSRPGTRGGNNKKYVSYGVSLPNTPSPYEAVYTPGLPEYTVNQVNFQKPKQEGLSFNNRPKPQIFEPRNSANNMREAWNDKYDIQKEQKGNFYAKKRMDRPRNKQGKFQKRTFNGRPSPSYNKNYCSLCGKTDHKVVDGCPNMVNDSGRRINMMPAKDTCTACPAHVQPRLAHTPALCPYRKGGIFNKSG